MCAPIRLCAEAELTTAGEDGPWGVHHDGGAQGKIAQTLNGPLLTATARNAARGPNSPDPPLPAARRPRKSAGLRQRVGVALALRHPVVEHAQCFRGSRDETAAGVAARAAFNFHDGDGAVGDPAQKISEQPA
jgi:hypothetical protein